MKTVALDMHRERTQLTVALETGEIVTERIVATKAESLRQEVARIPGPKQVILENAGWAAHMYDALKDVAEEVIVCDPTRNKLISKADDSNDERDAERLGILSRAGALRAIYVPPEPYRTLRALINHESYLTKATTGNMLRLKAFCRMHGVAYQGKGIYQKKGRAAVLAQFSENSRFQIESLYRLLDGTRDERHVLRTELRKRSLLIPPIKRMQTVPGIGPITARTLAAYIADPTRFKSPSALAAYAGLGLSQDISNWHPVRRTHASKRGQRAVKRVLFLAARAAVGWGKSRLAERYKARIASGWEDRKAIRDTARKILLTACGVWTSRQEYDDGRITVPVVRPTLSAR